MNPVLSDNKSPKAISRRSRSALGRATDKFFSQSHSTSHKGFSKCINTVGVPTAIILSTLAINILEVTKPGIFSRLPLSLNTSLILSGVCIITSLFWLISKYREQKRIGQYKVAIDALHAAGKIKESQMRALSDDSPLPILILTPNGQCCYANFAFSTFSNLKVEKVTGHGWKNLFSKNDFEEVFQGWIYTRDHRQKCEKIVDIKSADGSTKKVTLIMTPSLHEERYVCTVLAIFETREIAAPNAAISNTSTITLQNVVKPSPHITQLKSRVLFPIRRINQSLQRLTKKVVEDVDCRSILQSMTYDTEQALKVIEEFSLSHLVIKPEHSSSNKFNPVELASVVEEEVQNWKSNTKVSIGIVCDRALPNTLVGNPSGIRELVLMLLEHSYQNTSCGGIKMSVSHLAGENLLCLDIVDTGDGISAERLGAILRGEGEDLDISDTLYLASSLAKRMGAVIDIESLPRRGTTIQLLIPAPIDVSAVEKNSTFDNSTTSLNSANVKSKAAAVLIVGEEQKQAASISALLDEMGVESMASENYRKVLQDLGTEHFKLVILNTDLNDHVAARLSRILKEADSTLPIVALRQEKNEKVNFLANKKYFDEIVELPLDGNKLKQIVSRFLSQA